MSSNNLNPEREVVYGAVIRLPYKRIKELYDYLTTYPDTELLQAERSIGRLKIVSATSHPKLIYNPEMDIIRNHIDPTESVTFAVITKTRLKHIKDLRNFLKTYPDSYFVYNAVVSENSLKIESTDTKPILSLDEK